MSNSRDLKSTAMVPEPSFRLSQFSNKHHKNNQSQFENIPINSKRDTSKSLAKKKIASITFQLSKLQPACTARDKFLDPLKRDSKSQTQRELSRLLKMPQPKKTLHFEEKKIDYSEKMQIESLQNNQQPQMTMPCEYFKCGDNKTQPIEEIDVSTPISFNAFTEYFKNNQKSISKQFKKTIPDLVYADRIIEEIKNIDFMPSLSLANHQITGPMRAKMVDWIVEVMAQYKCCDQTFFLSLSIMDRFLQHSQIQQPVNELHRIGVTSMFVAAKYEEIYPIKLKTIHERIAHKKLSVEDIKEKEMEILEQLDYCITGCTVYDIVQLALFKVNLRQYIGEIETQFFYRLCIYMAKMSQYHYELVSQFNLRVVAVASIYVSLKIMEQITGINLLFIVPFVQQQFDIESNYLIKASTGLLFLARNFENLYPNLQNLRRFNTELFEFMQKLQTTNNNIQTEQIEQIKQ